MRQTDKWINPTCLNRFYFLPWIYSPHKRSHDLHPMLMVFKKFFICTFANDEQTLIKLHENSIFKVRIHWLIGFEVCKSYTYCDGPFWRSIQTTNQFISLIEFIAEVGLSSCDIKSLLLSKMSFVNSIWPRFQYSAQ